MGCNLLTGMGFDTGFFGGYSMAFLGLVIIVFIIMFVRRWIGEEAGIPFNTLFASIGAGFGWFLVTSLTCSSKWGFVAGIVGMILGGFIIGYFFTGGDY